MKEIKVDFSEYNPNLIYFITNFYKDKYIFIENKNFKTKTLTTSFQRHYFYLIDYLNLKQLKIEIFK